MRHLAIVLSLASVALTTPLACREPDTTPTSSVVSSPSAIPSIPSIPSSGPPKPSSATLCPARPLCDAPSPPIGKAKFKHTGSKLIAKLGDARHRGRDSFLTPDATAQWAIAKFAYGPEDKDLEDEEVAVFLEESCAGAWTSLGSFRTSDDAKKHPTVDGVEDHGGRVYVDLVALGHRLAVGRHRVRFVVPGDGTSADLFLEVIAKGATIVVSDVDGTLTTSEWAAWKELIHEPPPAHPEAAAVLSALAAKGHYIFYLTARPEWFTPVTRAWLADKGFPRGVLHTTTIFEGALGTKAAAFKSTELAMLEESTALVPLFAFGNRPSDVTAFGLAKIAPSGSYYFQLDGDLKGGTKIVSYGALLAELAKTSTVTCPP